MTRLVTIYGGSGFVGRYIARRMAAEGWRVRVAVRRPNEALFVKPYGVVGQVEPVLCNVRDDASVAAAMKGADAVVNCVGVLVESGKNTFEAVQASGAERLARLAAEEGTRTFVHISAIGADPDSASIYQRTKAQGEAAILSHRPDAVILRPSIIFGTEDGFFNRFAGMTRVSPILPIVGGNTRFQPVWVDDVAQAAASAAMDRVQPGIYELGGPDVKTFRELMEMMLRICRRKRVIMDVPFWMARIGAFTLDMMQMMTFGLFQNQTLTRDQVRNLAVDNVVSAEARGFADLDITPVAMEAVLPDYLWRFRPGGQYEAIKESAENLRT